jgi:cytochrome c-type biogenesis protein CcmF
MSDLGAYALRFALLIAIAGLGTAIHAGTSRREDWLRVAQRSVWVVFGFVTLAIATLFAAFASHDYQLAYVASHSARNMDLVYRLAALWGGQEGSLLLWLWMLTAYSAACVGINSRKNRRLMPWVVSVLLANAIFFLVLLTGVTDPFEKIPPGFVMSDGNGLNPLLQHPAMMIHPVMLYTGLVGFAVPFAFGFAALISGQFDTAWFRATRRWTLFAWFSLSIGIMLGGRWAYEVLGWGGYWAWDPVENASFMPWLPATAYLHSVMIQEKRDMLKPPSSWATCSSRPSRSSARCCCAAMDSRAAAASSPTCPVRRASCSTTGCSSPSWSGSSSGRCSPSSPSPSAGASPSVRPTISRCWESAAWRCCCSCSRVWAR